MSNDPFADLAPQIGGGQTSDPFADLAPQPQAPATTAPDTSWTNKAERFGLGALEPAIGLGQLAAHATGYGTSAADTAAQWEAQKYQEARKAAGFTPNDWDYWGGAGNVLSPVNFAPGAAVGRAAGVGRTLVGMAGRGAAAGAAYGAMEPVSNPQDYWSTKGEQAGTGAIAGGLAGPAVGALSKVIAPAVTKTAAQLADEGASQEEIQRIGHLQTLMAENVPLKPGQILGGTAERVENALETVPFIGAPIRQAGQRGLEGFDRAAARRALAPIGEDVPENIATGHDLFNHVEQRLGAAYDAAHANMSVRPDTSFLHDIQTTLTESRMNMPEPQQRQLQEIVNQLFEGRFVANQGRLDGQQIQNITSQLKTNARGWMRSPDASTRSLGIATDDLRDAFEAMLERQNPNEAPLLSQANLGWAHLVRLEKATANRAAGAAGTFSPTQLLSAEGQSAGKRTMARGEGLYQDIAEAGKAILPSKMPSSGTTERAATLGLIGGGTGALAVHPGLAAAALATPLLYSQTGQRLAQAALTQRPANAQALANILQQYAPQVAARAPLPFNGNNNQ